MRTATTHRSVIGFSAIGLSVALLAAIACGDDEVAPVVVPDAGKTKDIIGSGVNHPPELHKIGDKVIEVGQELVIEPKATDADGDSLKFSLYGKMPDGATWSDSPPRFKWTPKDIGPAVHLTFVVSDTDETDMEAVQIEVVTESPNHPPAFQPVAEQYPEVGKIYALQLQATDLDGDLLTFGNEGELPPDATVYPGSGLFEWTPPPETVNQTFEVTFTVTDSFESVSMKVAFTVLAEGQNKPPAFKPVGQQVAVAGNAYTLTVEAVDPDGDELTYGVEVPLPEGAYFAQDTHTLSWVPNSSQAGMQHPVVFWVTDNHYKPRFMVVDIFVQSTTVTPGQCKDDFLEPNDKPEAAATMTVGTYEKLSICDTESKAFDEDWFAVSLVQGQALSVVITFAHVEGDLDVHVYNSSNLTAPVAKAQSADDNESLTYGISTAATYLIRVFGVGQAKFAVHYDLEISTTGLGCTDDGMEPNDTFSTAKDVTPNGSATAATFCPANLDFFRVPITCGQTLTAKLQFKKEDGNLDLHLYRSSDTEQPVASAATTSAPETAIYEKAQATEDVFVLVTGNPPESTTNTYSLNLGATGGTACTDDAYEPNDKKEKATELKSPEDEVGGLTLCCSPDWFYVPIKAGEGMIAAVNFAGDANVTAKLISYDGVTLVQEGEPVSTGVLVDMGGVQESGTYYIVVDGEPGVSYDLEVVVATSEGCKTSKACEKDEVCWKATGKCVDASCTKDTDCPESEMPCWEGKCLDGCTYPADCKLEFACKGFAFGHYCGNDGTKKTGDACFTHEVCSGPSSCHFKPMGGYCTNIGCASNAHCPDDSDCVVFGETTLCGKTCKSNDDCRLDEGFSCQPKKLVNGVDTQVCLPIP